MFDKVVTPSDVGKLNRLVIPKQHAERYFPLDGSTNQNGLQLGFVDPSGKPWRFRYSYWNSSQSYVITKGWSRFVKEKRLRAGDTVSFWRGAGEGGRQMFFIDWRRLPDKQDLQNPSSFLSFSRAGVPWPPSSRLRRLLPEGRTATWATATSLPPPLQSRTRIYATNRWRCN
ncbi:unnamed protein product [Spirodela intermedia]|uniref:TF-B3 domain-containing protein n=1 Tax=Spirodela intermedia TaxID=51605 RepID=A0A7I8J9X1_SPIIN|nr:unnamed protein product [Spirodela intermedia]CAA6666771.1 unnamed protein product [Spirodela intermedia]